MGEMGRGEEETGSQYVFPWPLSEGLIGVGVSPEQFSTPVIPSVSSSSDFSLPSSLQAWCRGWVIDPTLSLRVSLHHCPVLK